MRTVLVITAAGLVLYAVGALVAWLDWRADADRHWDWDE